MLILFSYSTLFSPIVQLWLKLKQHRGNWKKFSIKKLSPLNSKIANLNSTVQELMNTVSFISKKYDEIIEKVAKIEDEKREILDENKKMKSEILNMSNELKAVKESCNTLEQYSRRDCVELRGIPIEEGTLHEDTNNIVIKVSEAMGLNVRKEDISVSHRLPVSRFEPTQRRTRSRPGTYNTSPIIIKFVRRDVRERFYSARKNLRDKSARDLVYHNDTKIYIVESLTQKNRELLKECIKAKNDLKFKFTWTISGRIMMRKEVDSPAIHIRSHADLKNLLRSNNIS